MKHDGEWYAAPSLFGVFVSWRCWESDEILFRLFDVDSQTTDNLLEKFKANLYQLKITFPNLLYGSVTIVSQ